MERREENPVNINPDEQTAETNRMHMQPGALDDIENASAYANRTGQHGTTSLRPDGADAGKRDRMQAGETSSAAANDLPPTDGRTDSPENPEGLTSSADPMR